MPNEPAIRQLLDLSTAHLPKHLLDDLNGEDGVIANKLRYGWLLWVPDDPAEHAEGYEDFPAEVLAIQRYARERGCDFVLLDADADRVDDLPTWDERS